MTETLKHLKTFLHKDCEQGNMSGIIMQAINFLLKQPIWRKRNTF